MSDEKDPHGLDSDTPGAKLDDGKPELVKYFISIFPNAMEEVARVSKFGADKYVYGGWMHVQDGQERYDEALVRHITKRAKGEFYDEDSGLGHDTHEAWNALAKLELRLMDDIKIDDVIDEELYGYEW